LQENLADMPMAERAHTWHGFNAEFSHKVAAKGWIGMVWPKQYSGGERSALERYVVLEEMVAAGAPVSLHWTGDRQSGPLLLNLGTEEQKQKYVPRLAKAEIFFCIGLSEPDAGSDLANLRTRAVKTDGGWVINGEKTWSSSAHVADYLLVLCRSDKNVEKAHHGVSLFWVPTKTEGINITPLAKLGMRSMGSCAVHFDNAFVPEKYLLGEQHKAWRMLLPTLNNERIMVGAFCTGVIDGVLEDALEYMLQRKAFGKYIGAFQSLQHYVADIATSQYTCDLMLNHCASLQSQNISCHMESSMLKITASEAANKAADLGIQIMGGMGYSAETDMQRYWRDSRLWRIGPITNEMARNGIAEGLGLPRSF